MTEEREPDPSWKKREFAKRNAIYFAIAGFLFLVAGVWGNLNPVLIVIGAANIVMSVVFWRRSQQ